MSYRSSVDAEAALVVFESDLRKAIEYAGIIDQQIIDIRRQLLELNVKRNDLNMKKNALDGPMAKAKENIQRIRSELRSGKDEFFRLRGEGQ